MKKILFILLIIIINTLTTTGQVSQSGKKPAIVHDWSWIKKEEGTKISTTYPEIVTYYRYDSHPEYRVIMSEAYDSKGNLVGKSDIDWEKGGILNDIREDYVLQANRKAFKRDKYGFSRESLGAQNYVKYILGLTKQRPKCTNNDIKVAERYLQQLSMDHSDGASSIGQIIRVTDTSFGVGLNDSDDMPNCFYLVEFTNKGKYDSKYTIQMTDDFIEGTLEGTEDDSKSETPKENPQKDKVVDQVNELSPSSTQDYKVETMPEFLPCTYKVGRKKVNNSGGQEGIKQYLRDNIKYPEDAEAQGRQGKVTVSFAVDVDGSVTDVRVERKVYPSLDNEAVRVVSSMPKWKPGTQDGKPVRVRYFLNIPFKAAP